MSLSEKEAAEAAEAAKAAAGREVGEHGGGSRGGGSSGVGSTSDSGSSYEQVSTPASEPSAAVAGAASVTFGASSAGADGASAGSETSVEAGKVPVAGEEASDSLLDMRRTSSRSLGSDSGSFSGSSSVFGGLRGRFGRDKTPPTGDIVGSIERLPEEEKNKYFIVRKGNLITTHPNKLIDDLKAELGKLVYALTGGLNPDEEDAAIRNLREPLKGLIVKGKSKSDIQKRLNKTLLTLKEGIRFLHEAKVYVERIGQEGSETPLYKDLDKIGTADRILAQVSELCAFVLPGLELIAIMPKIQNVNVKVFVEKEDGGLTEDVKQKIFALESGKEGSEEFSRPLIFANTLKIKGDIDVGVGKIRDSKVIADKGRKEKFQGMMLQLRGVIDEKAELEYFTTQSMSQSYKRRLDDSRAAVDKAKDIVVSFFSSHKSVTMADKYLELLEAANSYLKIVRDAHVYLKRGSKGDLGAEMATGFQATMNYFQRMKLDEHIAHAAEVFEFIAVLPRCESVDTVVVMMPKLSDRLNKKNDSFKATLNSELRKLHAICDAEEMLMAPRPSSDAGGGSAGGGSSSSISSLILKWQADVDKNIQRIKECIKISNELNKSKRELLALVLKDKVAGDMLADGALPSSDGEKVKPGSSKADTTSRDVRADLLERVQKLQAELDKAKKEMLEQQRKVAELIENRKALQQRNDDLSKENQSLQAREILANVKGASATPEHKERVEKLQEEMSKLQEKFKANEARLNKILKAFGFEEGFDFSKDGIMRMAMQRKELDDAGRVLIIRLAENLHNLNFARTERTGRPSFFSK